MAAFHPALCNVTHLRTKGHADRSRNGPPSACMLHEIQPKKTSQRHPATVPLQVFFGLISWPELRATHQAPSDITANIR